MHMHSCRNIVAERWDGNARPLGLDCWDHGGISRSSRGDCTRTCIVNAVRVRASLIMDYGGMVGAPAVPWLTDSHSEDGWSLICKHSVHKAGVVVGIIDRQLISTCGTYNFLVIYNG